MLKKLPQSQLRIKQKVVLCMLLVIGILIIPLARNTNIISESNQQCSKNADNLVTLQQQTANKEAAMMSNMPNMEMEHVTVSLNKSLLSHQLNACIAQITITINKGSTTLNEDQIYTTFNNTYNNRILAQYSSANDDKPNFIISLQTGNPQAYTTHSEFVGFEQSIGLN